MYRNLLFLISFFVISTHAFANNTSKSVAMGMISSNSMSKISTQELHNLMDENIQDFIVEFDTSSVPQSALTGLSKTEIMHTRSDMAKSLMRTMSNGDPDINVKDDYSMLPMMAIETANRAALAKILNRADVKRVFENSSTDTVQLQESLPLVNQPGPESQGHIGEGTSIAVLDTGVDYTLPPFGCTALNTPSTCRVSVAIDFAPNDGELDDDFTFGHGTNVAAIASSVAPGAKILALDVKGTGSDPFMKSYRMGAINWILANKSQYNIVAMNMSIGDNSQVNTPCSDDFFTTPFENLRNIGVIPVVSSGNSHHTNGINRPSCVPGAVSVGAVYDKDFGFATSHGCTDSPAVRDMVTCFSNTGKFLTLLALGGFINAGGHELVGTSQAAPHVAGAIAVLKANDVSPNDSVIQTIDHLTTTGKKIEDERGGIPSNQPLIPRLNLEAAINDAIIPPTGGDTPVTISPAQGSTVGNNPTFTWTEVVGAPRYAVVATNTDNNDSPVNNSTINNLPCPNGVCSYVHSSALPNGNYTWKVRVINADDSNGNESGTVNFTVN
ncbi:MAG: S8 family serine peptidase [Thiotrichaceae bacterium]